MQRILLVEDQPDNRQILRDLLGNAGYDLVEAGDGMAAVVRAMADKPDLILMDIQLPGIDGLETTKRIRQSDDISHIPIIAITSYAMAGDRERLIEAGCTGYIEKPINPETIMGEIAAYLK